MSADRAHPYCPNSAPAVRDEMLEALGLASPDELYAGVPQRLLLDRPLALPGPLPSELELRRHVGGLLGQDVGCDEYLSFLGGGCWQHLVPALCDEIGERAEFLTAYWADAYTDRGKYQAFFEYASLLGELLEMDAVSLPVYDWGSAAAAAVRMAARATGRTEVLVAPALSPERRMILANACRDAIALSELPHESATFLLDLDALEAALSERTAAVYLETPSYLGVIESRGAAIAELAHRCGAMLVVGVDPISLGVLSPPSEYGADIVCGELQPLGMHMEYGGGLAGFLATRDDEDIVTEYPNFLIGLAPTDVPGEHGFGLVAWDRTSYVRREHGKDFGGTSTGLWAIRAAVYLTLLGPAGLRELGEGILQRSHYAARLLEGLPGVSLPLDAPFFKELVVSFDETGKTVEAINEGLLERGILGGRDLSGDIPALGASALYCITEVHDRDAIDRLVSALEEVVS